ncbi:MAG: hypothetical protein ACQEP7_05600 [bacterium]
MMKEERKEIREKRTDNTVWFFLVYPTERGCNRNSGKYLSYSLDFVLTFIVESEMLELHKNKITTYVGGGLSWAETSSAIDEDFLSLDFPVGFEWKFEESPVALGIHTTGLLILTPEVDISLGQRIDFGLYYYF